MGILIPPSIPMIIYAITVQVRSLTYSSPVLSPHRAVGHVSLVDAFCVRRKPSLRPSANRNRQAGAPWCGPSSTAFH